MYINSRNTKTSIDFGIYERIGKQRKYIGYVASIKHNEIATKEAVKKFWYQVQTKFNEFSVPEDRYPRLLASIERHVPAPAVSIQKKKQRKSNDYYPTPEKAVHVLIHDIDIQGTVFEPCVGEARALAKFFPNCKTNDCVKSIKADFNLNAASLDAWKTFGQYDWIVTNPPFSQASSILPLAWDNCKVGVAFLLRITYLEPCSARFSWMQENARHLYHEIYLNPRIKFRADSKSTDSATTAWLVWRKDFDCRKQLRMPPNFAHNYHLE